MSRNLLVIMRNYTSQRLNKRTIQAYLRKLELPQVTQENSVKLTKVIILQEVKRQALKGGKSPGDDGFTNEFYKKCKDQISPLLVKACNYSLDTGIWAQTWASSIVTLIHEEGKDVSKCKANRPVSLFNIDYKIISAILANRLNDIITDIVTADQCGFISGRILADNIRQALNVVDLAQIEKTDLLLLTFLLSL